jgi:pimeloyl-ACP methyl ester carboxylesterase
VLVLAGELDNPEILRAAEVMAKAIPGAQKAVISGAAHLPNMEKPAEFNQALMDFLRATKEKRTEIQDRHQHGATWTRQRYV